MYESQTNSLFMDFIHKVLWTLEIFILHVSACATKRQEAEQTVPEHSFNHTEVYQPVKSNFYFFLKKKKKVESTD